MRWGRSDGNLVCHGCDRPIEEGEPILWLRIGEGVCCAPCGEIHKKFHAAMEQGGVGNDEPLVGVSVEGRASLPSDDLGAHSGEAHPGVGQFSDKSGQGRRIPSSAADAGSPDNCIAAGPSTGGNGDQGAITSSSAGDGAQLLTLDEARPKTPGMLDPWSDAA